ncbi:MAG: radical SAM family heme chaperone HemW [Deltaproteobacteria bacterium]|nr:radical SAM family heme chaperone HemW [Deltaproteobacteria bacterium]
MTTPLSVYIHIPFCEVKCGYCDFFSVPRGHDDFSLQGLYTKALIQEIQERASRVGPREIQTLFLGGGTPSLMQPALIEEILVTLQRHFRWGAETEITLESNPKTVSREKLGAFRQLGINRLSLGVQSFQDNYLKVMGRIHSGDEAKRTLTDAREAGFENLGLDLIYALPGQTVEEFEKELQTALSFETTHLSAYCLTIEEGTPFETLYARGSLRLPEEEVQMKMFEYLQGDRLKFSGLSPYEISNFARPGFECRHNLNYWNYGEYLGFGAGAVSYSRSQLRAVGRRNESPVHCYGSRRQNVRDLKRYLQGEWEDHTEEISIETAMGEFMMMGLRKRVGVSEDDFCRKFGRSMKEIYGPVLAKLHEKGSMGEENGRWFLTREAIPLTNEILVQF